jgi:hypothetical protein
LVHSLLMLRFGVGDDMADTYTLDGSMPQPLSSCPRCSGTEFDNGRRLGLSQEIFCRECGAGFRVNVLHDGRYLVEEISRRPRRHPQHRPGHRRRRTDK